MRVLAIGLFAFALSEPQAVLAVATPTLQVTPPSYTLSANVGSFQVQTLTIMNTGSADLFVSLPTFSPANAPYSVGTGSCPSLSPTLTAGSSCTMNLAFSPPAMGSFPATLTFASNDPASPTVVPLMGTGIGPAISVSSTTLTFSSPVNILAAQGLTIQNTGTAPLNLGSISVTSGTAQFTYSMGTCTTSLNPGSSCILSVGFMSSTGGNVSGALAINSDAPTSPTIVTLSGTATTSTAIPTLSEWGLMLMGGLLAFTMLLAMRRKRT